MKTYMPLIVSLIMFSPVVMAENSVSQNVRTFLDSYIAGDFEKASKQIYCPAKYSDEKRKEKQNQLEGEFIRMSEEYGKAIKYRQTQASLYSTVMLGCGTPEDYENIQPIGMDMVTVEYENGKKGIIQLFYLSTKRGPVFGLVGIGEPSISPKSIGRQYNLYKELKKSPNN